MRAQTPKRKWTLLGSVLLSMYRNPSLVIWLLDHNVDVKEKIRLQNGRVVVVTDELESMARQYPLVRDSLTGYNSRNGVRYCPEVP